MTSAPSGSEKIGDLLAAGRTLSFEFFPPKTDEAERQLEKAIHELAPLRPSFVSVTYGAGGSTRDRTRDIVVQINNDQPFPAMPHLTCSGHTRDEIGRLLDEYADAGVHNILALAGDPPATAARPSATSRTPPSWSRSCASTGVTSASAWPPIRSCTRARRATGPPIVGTSPTRWPSPTSPSRSSSSTPTTTCG